MSFPPEIKHLRNLIIRYADSWLQSFLYVRHHLLLNVLFRHYGFVAHRHGRGRFPSPLGMASETIRLTSVVTILTVLKYSDLLTRGLML